jgi:hypothetical protein
MMEDMYLKKHEFTTLANYTLKKKKKKMVCWL